MGAGIAQVAAQTGHSVTLVDIDEDLLGKSEKRIHQSIARVAKKLHKEDKENAQQFVTTSLANLKTSTTGQEALATADLVVEAVTENLNLKQKLFKGYGEICPEKTILASNTSSLSVETIMKDVDSSRLDRTGGLHFFNPVPVMKLLEVVRWHQTSDETFEAMMLWGNAMGKHCVRCKDTPGFIVNRLLVPYLQEAIEMVERGDASFSDVDLAMKLGAGHPMGPFELLDYVGLDLHKWIGDNPDNPLGRPSPIIDSLVKEGKFGRKTGEGFYKY